MMKVDSLGNFMWGKEYGGDSAESANSVQQTVDGGYILAGTTSSFGAGADDFYVIKTDANGDTLWTKTYGGTGNDECYSIHQTSDGGYIIGGWTDNIVNGPGFYAIKTDANGDTLWTNVVDFGGTNYNLNVNSCIEKSEGGYAMVGSMFNVINFITTGILVKLDAAGKITCYDSASHTIVGHPSTQVCSFTIHDSTGGITQGIPHTNQYTTVTGDIHCTHYCNAHFHLYPDTSLAHHYWAYNTTTGQGPLQFDWNWGDGHHDTIEYPTHIYDTSGLYNICLTITDLTGCTSTQCDSSFLIQRTTNTILWVNVIGPSYAGINEMNSAKLNSLHLSPNPFNTTATLTLQGTSHNPTLFIYNLLGQEVETHCKASLRAGTNTQFIINRNNLPAGMYFYKVIDENKEVLGIGKLLIE